MDANINRIPPANPLQQGAVRRIEPRGKREGEDAREFTQELANHDDEKVEPGAEERDAEKNEKASGDEKSPAQDGVTGTRLDVTG